MKQKPVRNIAPVFTAVVILYLADLFAQTSSCLSFQSPGQGASISTPSCTLSVDATCKNISRIEFQARYLSSKDDSAVVMSLGTITRPPYKLVWNTSQVPNQLFAGAAFLAEATLYDGSVEAVRREGVFLTHQPIARPSVVASYAHPSTRHLFGDTITLPSFRQSLTMQASLLWSEKVLTVVIDVKDPLFYTNMDGKLLTELGAEILIDPAFTREPFPGANVLIYAVPLSGKPYQVLYTHSFESDGSFKLESSSRPCDFSAKVTTKDFAGFTIAFQIPRELLGKPSPDSIGCNIVIKALESQNGASRRVSWIRGSVYDAYSPVLWGTVGFGRKPLLMSRAIIGLISFGAGLLIPLLAFLLMSALRKPHLLIEFERSEEEQQHFERIKTAIDSRITSKKLSIEQVAHELRISASKLNSLVKKHTGLSFNHYVMYCRIEIARERLRSSHSSEASIAGQCGFQNVNEMERYFVRFHHTTPYKFRLEQQVA